MTNPNDGGPAFPTTLDYGERGSQTIGGMTLRDWLAGQALAAIINADGPQYFHLYKPHATVAYEQADAMLAAREVKP